jgi:hypothetical protein
MRSALILHENVDGNQPPFRKRTRYSLGED